VSAQGTKRVPEQRGAGRNDQRHVIQCHVWVANDALIDMKSRGTIRCDGVEAMLPKVDCVEIVICHDDRYVIRLLECHVDITCQAVRGTGRCLECARLYYTSTDRPRRSEAIRRK